MTSFNTGGRPRRVWDESASRGFGGLSCALGLVELFAPRPLLRWLGVDSRAAPLLRLFGLREIGAGMAIFSNPLAPQYLWARVAGDVLDIAVLGAALRPRSRRTGRVDVALATIGVITLLDVIMSARLTKASR